MKEDFGIIAVETSLSVTTTADDCQLISLINSTAVYIQRLLLPLRDWRSCRKAAHQEQNVVTAPPFSTDVTETSAARVDCENFPPLFLHNKHVPSCPVDIQEKSRLLQDQEKKKNRQFPDTE